MQYTFLNSSGVVLFARNDAESAEWTQEEYTLNAVFPYVPGKVIERGQRIYFRDPVTNNLELFEIRNVQIIVDAQYQQIVAEHIAVSELSDEHINTKAITDKTAGQAVTEALTGTLWALGNNTASGTQSVDISRGSVWQAIKSIETNYNVYITPRVVVNASGAITGRYLDVTPAQPVFRGLRLSFDKNMYDPAITYDDTGLYTALYGYGGSVDVPQGGGGEDQTQELTFASVVWTATQDHPAKPNGQTYLEDPAKTALYGRNGRPRFGYYQNSNIKDANILLQKTWETLKTVSDPVISIVGTVAELTRLGKIDVPVRLHDAAIVEIKPQGVNIQKEIIKAAVNLEDPTATRVEIGAYIPNIVYINRETAKKSGGGGGGGGHGQTNQEHFDGETYTDWVKTNEMIGMVVGTYNGGYKIKAGEITLAINEDGGTTAKISADAIDVDGIIEDLKTVNLEVAVIDAQDGQSVFSDIFTTDITVDDTVDCYTLDVSEISAGGSTHGVSWKSYTARYCATTSQNYTFYDTSGTSRSGRLITSITDTTIHYLGY